MPGRGLVPGDGRNRRVQAPAARRVARPLVAAAPWRRARRCLLSLAPHRCWRSRSSTSPRSSRCSSRRSGASTRSPAKLVHNWTLDNFRTLWQQSTYRTDRAADDLDRRGGDGHGRDHRVPVRLLHGAGRAGGRTRAVLFVLVLLPLWASLPRARLRVAADPQLRTACSTGRCTRSGCRRPGSRTRTRRCGSSSRYIWLPFMILPVYAALERIPHSYIEASRDLGAQGLPHAPHGDPAARAARHRRRARSSRSR